jgi:hypothetical protein
VWVTELFESYRVEGVIEINTLYAIHVLLWALSGVTVVIFCIIYVRIIRGSNASRGRTSRPALEFIHSPNQWILGSFPGVKPGMALS